jgi:plastocyanin
MRLAVLSIVIVALALAGCSSSPTPAPAPPATLAPAPTTAPAVVPSATRVPPAPTTAPTAASTSTAAASPTIAAASAVTPTTAAASSSKQVQVEAQDDFFRPKDITVTVGTTVTWINLGQKKHTVTNDTLFDDELQVGDTFSYTFDKIGYYQYYCTIHSESETDGMVGTVTVVKP